MKFLQTFIFTLSFFALFSCQKNEPKNFSLQKDQCDNCKMTITELNHATEIVTEKGRAYKFDDINCMEMFEKAETDKMKNAKKYVIDAPSGKFVELQKATLITGGSIKSPMGGNTQAYENKETAVKAAKKLGASVIK